jgi:hypothetical protein
MPSIKKEKTDRQMAIMVQPSLYEVFEAKCVEEHRTVSEVIRELMSKHSQGWVQLPNNKKCPDCGSPPRDLTTPKESQ